MARSTITAAEPTGREERRRAISTQSARAPQAARRLGDTLRGEAAAPRSDHAAPAATARGPRRGGGRRERDRGDAGDLRAEAPGPGGVAERRVPRGGARDLDLLGRLARGCDVGG